MGRVVGASKVCVANTSREAADGHAAEGTDLCTQNARLASFPANVSWKSPKEHVGVESITQLSGQRQGAGSLDLNSHGRVTSFL